MDRLLEVLNLLASECSIQLDLFPKRVVIADEFALLFYDELMAQQADLRRQGNDLLLQDLVNLDEKLSEMGKNSALWSNESLESSIEWKEVRQIATCILLRMGATPRRPNLNWIHYC